MSDDEALVAQQSVSSSASRTSGLTTRSLIWVATPCSSRGLSRRSRSLASTSPLAMSLPAATPREIGQCERFPTPTRFCAIP